MSGDRLNKGLAGLGFGITKRLNREQKRKNHLENLETRCIMNQAADGSEGKNPRPSKMAHPPSQYKYNP